MLFLCGGVLWAGKKSIFKAKTLNKGHSRFIVWENCMSQGVENRGSLISVPLALRVVWMWLANHASAEKKAITSFRHFRAYRPSRQSMGNPPQAHNGRTSGAEQCDIATWGSPKPVTLKPVSRTVRTFRVFYAAPIGAFFVVLKFVRSRVLGRDFFNRFESP